MTLVKAISVGVGFIRKYFTTSSELRLILQLRFISFLAPFQKSIFDLAES